MTLLQVTTSIMAVSVMLVFCATPLYSCRVPKMESINEEWISSMNSSEHLRALVGAASEGNVPVVRLLLRAGTNVSDHATGCFSPLFICTIQGQLEVCRLLIEAGANVNVRQSILELTPLHTAVDVNQLEAATLLLDSGADVNIGDFFDETPLHIAASIGNARMCQLLLDRGALVNITDRLGNTPMHLASNVGHTHIVQLLTKRGGDPEAKNYYGQTPQYLANRKIDFLQLWNYKKVQTHSFEINRI